MASLHNNKKIKTSQKSNTLCLLYVSLVMAIYYSKIKLTTQRPERILTYLNDIPLQTMLARQNTKILAQYYHRRLGQGCKPSTSDLCVSDILSYNGKTQTSRVHREPSQAATPQDTQLVPISLKCWQHRIPLLLSQRNPEVNRGRKTEKFMQM